MNVSRSPSRRSPTLRASVPPRRGSVLVVVLALLSALMLLGFLFYTLASQERENARYFTASEKWYAAELSPDELFDFALEQIIVGPQDDYPNSALWGGRYSLLASLVGDDIQPYSGPGVNVADADQLTGGPGNGFPVIDQNRNGVADVPADDIDGDGNPDTLDADGDSIYDQLALNLGEFSGISATANVRNYFAKPDVGYSYPDLNSPFLAYIGTEPASGNRVIIPSFHRPQYLRGLFNGTVAPADWYIDPVTKPYVLRPHAERKIRKFDYSSGTIVESTLNRFTDANVVNPTIFEEGHWSWDGTAGADAAADFYELDVDADRDGVKEAVLVDLDHPVEETPDGSQQFIPLFAVTLYDLDALFNLNAHGNLYGDAENLANGAMGVFGNGDFISRSNEGRQRPEINPQVGLDAGLDATPGVGPAHTDFFMHGPANAIELANMELWFLLAGRVDYKADGTIQNYHLGRWGEQVRLDAAYAARSSSAYDYSRPGQSNSDEAIGTTADGSRGLAYNDYGTLFPRSVIFPAPGAPEDHQGQGTFVDTNGKSPLLARLISGAVGAQGRVQTIGYVDYWTPGFSIPPSFIDPVWVFAQRTYNFAPLIAEMTTIGVRSVNSIYGGNVGRLIDDPGETIISELARDQATDQIFGADETAFLHLDGNNPAAAYSIVSRLLNLVPANFRDSTNAAERRKRYTTVSTDLKTYSLAPGRMRPWETRTDLAAATDAASLQGANVFPPLYGAAGSTVDPFRIEARGMLQQLDQTLVRQNAPNAYSSYDSDVLKGLIRKLSVNHVASAYITDRRDRRPRYILRPVTPHPTPATIPAGTPPLTAAPIPVPAIQDKLDFDNDNDRNEILAPGTSRPYFGVSDELLTLNQLTTQSLASPPLASGFQTTAMVAWPAAMQEWYARRDRQNLARDIYTLLYTLGNQNGVNVTITGNTPPGAVYTTAQLVEMAQFAVNLVDAMDPDDTVTCFVFDLDLSNGYTLYDDGYAEPVTSLIDIDPAVDLDNDGDPANDLTHYIDTTSATDARGMVFGVEAQKLAFSEALAVFAKKYVQPPSTMGSNHAATQWDDSKHRDFVYVELQNMTPMPVTMDGGWSIVLDPAPPTGSTLPRNRRSLTIVDGSQASPGSVYTIGVAGDRHTDQDGNALADSVMRIDPNTGASGPSPTSFTDIAPAGGPTAAGVLNFDPLAAATNNTRYRVNNFDPTQAWGDGAPQGEPGPFDDPDSTVGGPPDPKAGVWLDLGDQVLRDSISDADIIPIRFSLRRRLNLNRPVPDQVAADSFQNSQKDNPWIEVDVIEVPLKIMSYAGSSAADVQTALETNVISKKRREPLDRHPSQAMTGQGQRSRSQYQQNNLGGYHTDDLATGAFTWQRHFDRSFASLADVLNVPLYGPHELTKRLALTSTGPAVADKTAIAASRFLFPDGEPRQVGDPTPTPILPTGNLWYRILEFVEVPQKYGDDDGLPWFAHYGGPAPWGRTAQENLRLREFGKINVNTLRHPHVLGGLLDDTRVFSLTDPDGALPWNPSLPGTTASAETWQGGANRDWWQALLSSRDGGFDPFPYGTAASVVLPGLPSSKPFREFGAMPATNATGIRDSFNQTLLRSLPGDQTGALPTLGRRSLFELGNLGSAGTLGSDAEFATRYRLLGKVLNHGTTRSNTYVAFLTCDFYEATAVDDDSDPSTPDVFQVGARLPVDGETTPDPRYRGVFVIDRTLALQMLQRRDLPPTDAALKWPPGPVNNAYSTYSFAREIGSGGRPTPTFDWKDLVLYRKVTKAQ